MPAQRSDSLLLQTRARWDVPNELRRERPKASLQAAVELARQLCPEAMLRSITSRYNCTGLVVASRRVWVDPEHIVRILTEDGCRKLRGAEEADRGDVVIYHDDDGQPCHAAIVLWKNLLVPGEIKDVLTVLSKWGGDGEYIHQLSKLPGYLGRPAEFWTDRRSV